MNETNEQPDEDGADYQTVWEAELERRWQEMESGEVVGKPADEVFAELRKKFLCRRRNDLC